MMRKYHKVIILNILSFSFIMIILHLNFCHNCVCQIYQKSSKNINIIKVMEYDFSYHTSDRLQDIEEDLSESKCKSCKVDVPKVIIQYGPPRSASTLQYQILCLMMVLVHERDAKSVGCYFNNRPLHKYSVIKTHGVNYFFEALTENAWIFMTSGGATSLPKWKRQLELIQHKLKYLNTSVRYISDLDVVFRKGHFIAYEYQPFFGLTDSQMTQVVEYLRYWDILRLCCGRQMSMDWRNYLSPVTGYKNHHDPHNPSYPACEMYNISKVEHLFIKTYIYQRFAHILSIRDTLGKPSTIDGKLDGQYCERCNKNITRYNITETGDRCIY